VAHLDGVDQEGALTADLSEKLRTGTHERREAAGRSGIMPALLRGRLRRNPYTRLLRNLHAIYDALETALDANRESPWIAPILLDELRRTGALAADLDTLAGNAWPALPLSPSAHALSARISAVGRDHVHLLPAHAWVRYTSDLSAAPGLAPVVIRALQLPDAAGTAFHHFGSDAVADALRDRFLEGLDRLPADEAAAVAIVAEANRAYAWHVLLLEELAPRRPR
jgi:heme oxygenase